VSLGLVTLKVDGNQLTTGPIQPAGHYITTNKKKITNERTQLTNWSVLSCCSCFSYCADSAQYETIEYDWMNGHTAAAAVNSTKEENEREINKIKN
jgi:hypothetical protein